MSLSQSDIYILNRITSIVNQTGNNDTTIKEILHVLRDELRSRGLFVVLERSKGHSLYSEEQSPFIWYDLSDDISGIGDAVCTQAIEAFFAHKLDPDNPQKLPKGFMLCELPQVNNNMACIMGYECPDGTECSVLVKLVSSYISLLLKNVDLTEILIDSRDTTNQRINEIAAIYEIGKATEESAVDPLLNLIVSKAAIVMDAQACSLMLSDEEGALVIKASYGLADEIVNQTRINFGEGIAGHVAVTGEPMLIADVVADPRLSNDIQPRSEISGSICIPLKDEDGMVYGVLSIRRHFPKPTFTEDDLKLFQVFGTHAGLAISNGELYTRLNSKITEMATISDVLRTVNSSMALDDRLQRIAEAITLVVGFDRCCVYLMEDKTVDFVSRAESGYSDLKEIKERIPIEEGIFGIAASERIPVFTNNRPGSSQDADDVGGEYLVAPIVVKDSCIGVVVVDNSITQTHIDNEQVTLLATFVNQAGIAVENARLYEAMQQRYDELNVLYEHSRSISAAYGLQSASEALLQTCNQAVKCTGSGVVLLDTLRGSARLLTTSGDLNRISADMDAVLESTPGLQFIRALRQPVVLSHHAEGRDECPISSIYDKRWPANKRNIVMVPLITEDTVIGIVVLSRSHLEEFKDNDIKLLTIIAGHAAMVIRNAYILEQSMSQKVLELTTLYDFSSRITSSGTLAEAFESILAILGGLVDFDESFVYVVDKENGVAIPRAARTRGNDGTLPPEERLDGQGIVSWVVNESKAIVSPDLPRDRRFSGFYKGKSKVRSVMAIPLVVHDEVVAALVVYSENPKQYTEDNVRVLSIIASQGAAIFSELQALNRLSSYTDNILASIAAGVITLDQNNTVISWNAAAERITGISASDIIGKQRRGALDILPVSAEETQTIHDAITNVLRTRETYHGYKLKFNKADKSSSNPDALTELYVNMSISLLRDRAGNNLGLVIIFEDITHELEMETKFHRMSELASIGQLAANIAHELRNPLSSIKGAAQFLQNEYVKDAAVTEFLGIIIDEVNGLNSLTTEFLDFARPMQLNMGPTSLNKLVNKNIQLMNVTIKQNDIILHTLFEEDLPEIQADAKQIEQVLRNVILNAIQAMPEGGELTISTESRPGGVSMSINDTGSGIQKDQLDRIFQPFFTTKTKGTGLGLSIVNKIVENHSGRIVVESAVGEGTTVTVILPLSSEGPVITYGEDGTLERRVSRGLRELQI